MGPHGKVDTDHYNMKACSSFNSSTQIANKNKESKQGTNQLDANLWATSSTYYGPCLMHGMGVAPYAMGKEHLTYCTVCHWLNYLPVF
ncbi:hypothetical protein FKM82_023958 [Ascaphus truei]